jgi:hypothetical protein
MIERLMYQVLDTFPTTMAGMDYPKQPDGPHWLFLTYQKRRVMIRYEPTQGRVWISLNNVDDPWSTANYWRALERVLRLLAFGEKPKECTVCGGSGNG